MNWQTLSTQSHYKTAVAIRSELELGKKSDVQGLSWQEVFADDYELDSFGV